VLYDEDRLAKLSSELNNALNQLVRLESIPEADFLKDTDKIASAKYHFLLAIQSAIDICLHLISMNKLSAPADYADAFRIIGSAANLESDYTTRLENAARFRNRLVHLYWMVDTVELRRILSEDLIDLRNFLPRVGKVLD